MTAALDSEPVQAYSGLVIMSAAKARETAQSMKAAADKAGGLLSVCLAMAGAALLIATFALILVVKANSGRRS